MSYEPTNWKDGDLVTSAKLNKLEQGVANGDGIFIVHVNTQTGALDKTWQEIYDAGFGVMTASNNGLIFYRPITIIDPNRFGIGIETGGTMADVEWYIAQSADDYPALENSNNNDNNDNDIPPAN